MANVGAQSHHLVLVKTPWPTTDAQLVEAIGILFGTAGPAVTPSANLPEWATDLDALADTDDYLGVLSGRWLPI